MKFNGAFTIDDVTTEEVWLALSDPVMIKHCLPGCKFLTEVDDPNDANFEALAAESPTEDPPTLPEADPEAIAERSFDEGATYAATVEIGVGSVSPTFNSIVTINEREFPTMVASGEGSDSSNSFEMRSGMELSEADGSGVVVEWWADAEVFGRLAQMGQRVLNPVTNRVVNRFFSKLEKQLSDVDESNGLRGKIRDLV